MRYERVPVHAPHCSPVTHLVATLDEFSVPTREKDELLALVGSLEKDIVEK